MGQRRLRRIFRPGCQTQNAIGGGDLANEFSVPGPKRGYLLPGQILASGTLSYRVLASLRTVIDIDAHRLDCRRKRFRSLRGIVAKSSNCLTKLSPLDSYGTY